VPEPALPVPALPPSRPALPVWLGVLSLSQAAMPAPSAATSARAPALRRTFRKEVFIGSLLEKMKAICTVHIALDGLLST
jgi:hypothetical protein